MLNVAGPGYGYATHMAGKVTGWLTHYLRPVEIAAVGSPHATRPMPSIIVRRRSNQLRSNLNPTEVAYLEAVRFFDTCAEVSWREALRITANNVEHRQEVRPDLLMDVALAERGRNVAMLRKRIADVCAVISGSVTPPERSYGPDEWSGTLTELEAAHLPWLIEEGHGYRNPTVPISQLVKNWAHWPDLRARMCEREPVGPNRLDLVRIATTVHALCDQDGVEVPAWVWQHRWHEDVRIYVSRPPNRRERRYASPACKYHRVWFYEEHVTDYRIHGFWQPPT